MIKKSLPVIFVLLILFIGFGSAAICDDNQTILRLSASTNAHGATWDNSASTYTTEICYNSIFGAPYSGPNAGANVHNANAGNNNTVLRLSATTNAHAEIPGLSTSGYFNVSYGDLVCASRSGSCSPDERLVASLSGNTNAHLSNSTDYSILICCSSASAPTGPINGVCGTNLNTCSSGNFVDKPDNSTHNIWDCNGQNGGSNALNCSSPISAGSNYFNISSAIWNPTSVNLNNQVSLIIGSSTTANSSGIIGINIFECDDSDNPTSTPCSNKVNITSSGELSASFVLNSNQAVISWTVNDTHFSKSLIGTGSDNLYQEFYFEAFPIANATGLKFSGILNVSSSSNTDLGCGYYKVQDECEGDSLDKIEEELMYSLAPACGSNYNGFGNVHCACVWNESVQVGYNKCGPKKTLPINPNPDPGCNPIQPFCQQHVSEAPESCPESGFFTQKTISTFNPGVTCSSFTVSAEDLSCVNLQSTVPCRRSVFELSAIGPIGLIVAVIVIVLIYLIIKKNKGVKKKKK